uniref:Protocadherin 2 alpha a 15 n=1 Tax=Neolamprologus brichardi TaxID=32507 RepID=A0A3Q4MGM9_NEOBR
MATAITTHRRFCCAFIFHNCFRAAEVLYIRRTALGQFRYSISEEVQDGTIVGNIAKDLGLDKSALTGRGYRIVTGSTESLFQVNQNDGILYVKRRIDREELVLTAFWFHLLAISHRQGEHRFADCSLGLHQFLHVQISQECLQERGCSFFAFPTDL